MRPGSNSGTGIVFLLAGALVFLSLGVKPSPLEAAAPAESIELWPVPEAAWHRLIGDHPPGATGTVRPMQELRRPDSRTKRGVPVGGIGAGSFMLNLAGSFGPWEFDIGGDASFLSAWMSEKNSGHEERFLKEAAFHVYEKDGSRTVIKTLATEDVMPAWPLLSRGEGTYYALFPKAWFVYEGFPAPIAMKQFSPFVARNERLSSLPVGLFQFAVANSSDHPVEAAVMFTFPNAIYRRDTVSYRYPRQGLRSMAENAGGVVCVRLQAEHPDNVPETQRTEWVIAVRQADQAIVSYTEDWAADRDGRDVIDDFSEDGVLSDRPLDPRRQARAGAVAIKVELAPGERRVLSFALAWDFPVVQFKNTTTGTRWEKRYKEWYPGDFRARDIAAETLMNAEQMEAAVDGWWNKVVFEPAYPLWLRQAALNELYYDVFGGSFWENRCLSKQKRFGARPGQHLYFTLEANVYRDAETMDIRHYETRHLLELFPGIERDVLLGWSDLILDDPLGHTPHDAGSPVNDPWFVYGQYYNTSPGLKPPNMKWKDNPSRFVQQVFAYWKYTNDGDFLREAYPAAKKTMAYLASFDQDGNGLPESDGPDTSYDALSMRGESTYVSALYIGALESIEQMARGLGQTEEAANYEAMASRARQETERLLWDEAGGYYRLDVKGANSSALMADALNGERYPQVYGLPHVLDQDRMARHLWKVYQLNVLGFEDGRYGAINVVNADGSPVKNLMGQGTWPGGTYFTAAIMYHLGKTTGRPELIEAALATARATYNCTYQDERMAFWFDTPAIWYPSDPTRFRSQQNMRPRAVWELLLEIKDPFN
ncbi:MAG TPA: GH116 family glycosyl hydrolase [bacterium]|nr:GH116 family glycosyl hydrolase [bacterium]